MSMSRLDRDVRDLLAAVDSHAAASGANSVKAGFSGFGAGAEAGCVAGCVCAPRSQPEMAASPRRQTVYPTLTRMNLIALPLP